MPAASPADPLVVGGDSETREGGPDYRAEGAGGRVPLPCLNSHKCNGDHDCKPPEDDESPAWNKLQGGHRKTAYSLRHNVAQLMQRAGAHRVGFLTLTFPDHVTDNAEASRRWRSLRTGVLGERYAAWVAVRERQKSGRLHFHVLIVTKDDIRTGREDYEAFRRRDYRTANAALRAEWAFWGKTAKAYGFGRTELLPVKSNAEGLSRYVGKYIAKNIDGRKESDRGARLVMYSRSMETAGAHLKPNAFAWNSPRAWLWRQRVGKVAERCGIRSIGEFREHFGTTWAFSLAKRVLSQELGSRSPEGATVRDYPTPKHARADGVEVPPEADQDAPCVHSVVITEDTWRADLSAWLVHLQTGISFGDIRAQRHAWVRESFG